MGAPKHVFVGHHDDTLCRTCGVQRRDPMHAVNGYTGDQSLPPYRNLDADASKGATDNDFAHDRAMAYTPPGETVYGECRFDQATALQSLRIVAADLDRVAEQKDETLARRGSSREQARRIRKAIESLER